LIYLKIILIEINGTKLDSAIWISFIRKLYSTRLYGHYYINFEICGIQPMSSTILEK